MGKRYDEAVARVRERIEQGQVLTAYNALAHEDTTVGPYQTAVDWGVRYSVIS